MWLLCQVYIILLFEMDSKPVLWRQKRNKDSEVADTQQQVLVTVTQQITARIMISGLFCPNECRMKWSASV